MRNPPIASVVIAVSMLFACVSSCKKKSTLQPAKYTGCSISTILQYNSDTNNNVLYRFGYNDDGSISKIYAKENLSGNYTINFVYKNNSILAITIPQGNTLASYLDSISLDNENRVTYINHRSLNGFPPPYILWDEYLYDSLGQMYEHVYQTSNVIFTDTLQWLNGDLMRFSGDIRASMGSYVFNFIYTDTLYNVGNINARIVDLISYGRPVYTFKHLRKYAIFQYSPNADTSLYLNQTDNGGKLVNAEQTPEAYNTNSTITYLCE